MAVHIYTQTIHRTIIITGYERSSWTESSTKNLQSRATYGGRKNFSVCIYIYIYTHTHTLKVFHNSSATKSIMSLKRIKDECGSVYDRNWSFKCNLENFSSSKLLSSVFLQMYSGLILILYSAVVANLSSRKTELYVDQFVYDLYSKNWPITVFHRLLLFYFVRIIPPMILSHTFICHRGYNVLPIDNTFE